ncbi:MAG: hypothetical protein IAE66_06255 [Xanthomonadaceae bacterium]|nr:hypothetical protein [Xanthomonadaceae bacterium]
MSGSHGEMVGATLANKLDELQKQLTGPGADAFLQHFASTVDGRRSLQDTLAMVRRDGADAARVAKSCSKISAQIEKALKRRRWGVRA